MREFPPLLAVLERHGVVHAGRFVTPPEDPEAAEAARGIGRLGAHRVMRLAAPAPGEDAYLVLALSGGAGSDFDTLNAKVADCIGRKRDKLERADADERHLFVWVHEIGAWMAMIDLPPPSEAPEVLPPIDVVWAAVPDAPTGVGKLYRLHRGGSWEQCEVPTIGNAV